MTQWILYSALLTFLLIFMLRPIALKLNLLDSPSVRKLHIGDIPLTGGLAIYLVLISAVIIFIDLTPLIVDLLIGLSAILLVGIIDDRFNINPKVKFLCQLFIAIFLT